VRVPVTVWDSSAVLVAVRVGVTVCVSRAERVA